MAMALAGFSAGQADQLRRAMTRKRSREAMTRLWTQFRDGRSRKASIWQPPRRYSGNSSDSRNMDSPKAMRRHSPSWPTSRHGSSTTTPPNSFARC